MLGEMVLLIEPVRLALVMVVRLMRLIGLTILVERVSFVELGLVELMILALEVAKTNAKAIPLGLGFMVFPF
jgi:hypothetical protein